MKVTQGLWRTRPAFHVESSTLNLVIMETGCHLASLILPGDSQDTNPLWQPQWPSGDPSTAAALGTWGTGKHAVEAPLLASICGSNLCTDRFGAPYPDDAPRPLHGEGGVVPWSLVSSSDTTCTFKTELAISGWSVLRSFTVSGQCLTVTSTMTHATSQAPLNIEVCEHTTLGGAFLDGCEISASIGDLAYDMPGDGEVEREPASMPSATALVVPAPDAPPCGSVRASPVVTSTGSTTAKWTATNASMGRRLTATWDATEFPWLCLWTEHKQRTNPPWDGRERTRGMEISTKPFPQVPPPSRETSWLGIPTRVMAAPGEAVVRSVHFTYEKV